MMCSVRSYPILGNFGVVLPPFHRPQEEGFDWLVEAHARAAATFEGREDAVSKWRERITRLVRRYTCGSEHIGWRRSNIEDFTHTDWQRMKVFNLHENPQGKGLAVRSRFYAETTNRVVEELFADENEPPSDLLHVSCTGYASPSPIQRLIVQKHWHDRTQATQIYHMGCYAAVPALRVAAALLLSGPGNGARRADIVHTELCTLHFNPLDHSPEQLIVQSLFADGHIRYSMTPGNGHRGHDVSGALRMLSVGEEIVPDSLEDMTWVLSDWGFRMTLSLNVPAKLAAALPCFLTRLFSAANRDYREDAGATVFAVHPGGPRILDSVADVLGLKGQQLSLSRSVLFERGNMSSATLPHIWMAAASDPAVSAGTLIASLAFGPGLTLAGALFQKC